MAIVRQTHGFHDVVTTFYDSAETTRAKYPDHDANRQFLEDNGQGVLYNVDATSLMHFLAGYGGKYDLVLFYFPHTGVSNTCEQESILSNKALVAGLL